MTVEEAAFENTLPDDSLMQLDLPEEKTETEPQIQAIDFELDEPNVQVVLQYYYHHLFPFKHFSQWLSYGSGTSSIKLIV
jgi:hypothetical protein